jgi:hypothetical protein
MAKKELSDDKPKGRTISIFFPENPTEAVVVTFDGMFTGRDIYGAQRELTLKYRTWKHQMIRDAAANQPEEVPEELFKDLK